MDNTYRLKIQIHGNSFEAEGDRETVQEQFQAFKEMILQAPQPIAPIPQLSSDPTKSSSEQPITNGIVPFNEQSLGKIMRLDAKVVSLTVRPKTVQDALLLLVYGQKVLRQNELASGGVLLSGLITTGGYSPIGRVDRLLHNMGLAGDLIVTGEHRAKKYRLSNSGLTKVRQIATELLATVA
jgi:hypothetical protein